MTPAALLEMAERLDTAQSGGKLRFSFCKGEGWVTCANELTISLLCDMWNARHEIAAALRARASAGEK